MQVEPDDAAFARASAKGDPTAFGALVLRYQTRVFNLMRHMAPSREDAADLTQEAFVRAWRAIGRYDPSRPLLPWLLRIAVNACRDEARRRARHPEVPMHPNATDARVAEGPEEAFLAAERTRQLWAAVGALAPGYRLPVLLYYQQEMEVAEIAETLGLPVTVVKNRLYRARRAVRLQLATVEGGEHPERRASL